MATKRNPFVIKEARRLLYFVTKCAYCQRQGSKGLDPDRRPWHMEHVVPLARGGSDNLDNITKACEACNMDKGTDLWASLSRNVITAGRVRGRIEFHKGKNQAKQEKWKRERAKKRAAAARQKAISEMPNVETPLRTVRTKSDFR